MRQCLEMDKGGPAENIDDHKKRHIKGRIRYTITEVGNTVSMDGWKVSMAKSEAEELVWQKKGEADLKWTFEEEVSELKDHGIDPKLIIKGKRRRGADYVKLDKDLAREQQMARKERERLSAGRLALEEIRRVKRRKAEKATSSSSAADSKQVSQKKKKQEISVDDVKAHKMDLEKADLPASKALAILETLQNSVINIEILKKTLIGKTINPYRKHEDVAVAAQAKKLYASWKEVYRTSVAKK
uniref:TFIIS N-terminal domain-containing protein n=1 Tax=Lotharella globosa TaxID=91324 RepID=A0A6V3JH51_9EUKA|mmetsp:Transcript_35642/g.68811  ORF Transcript_35642/g.68811 Transcript_35642/m.68811 type:complete len:243 (+) Transcript_35642:237-965(+)|eukprot:CAMPEP_0167777260 /NCGR_PEP_ID=MMETSP0111_2-20121227/3594_1 /TAXON_ID=91324 /ORGANISM="Lotharella globosa, Strain CCCM811" /LENGTH=242 /DNA_ID=CAMNT_0007667423 /DNA_START=174 /DNA_END=902 /DNA_ORIENTATION=+